MAGIRSWCSIVHTDPENGPRVLGEFARCPCGGGSLLLGMVEGTRAESFPHAVTTACFRSIEEMSQRLVRCGFPRGGNGKAALIRANAPRRHRRELAERLQVTTRTIRNDVDRLRDLCYPVHASPGAAGGYRLGASAQLPPLLLDDDEAVGVALSLRTQDSETAVRALLKLEQVLRRACATA